MKTDKLAAYKDKRDFNKTREPIDETVSFDWARKGPIFVIQKHDASRLHYDFRIEVDGVLRSWAIPKGPSINPGVRRLAVPTEDHPIAYADFEGVIPESEYGGGTIMVWDRGIYRNLSESEEELNNIPTIAEQLDKGHVKIWLEGQKLRGGYSLIRTGGGRKNDRWLLIKNKDGAMHEDEELTETETASVKTGRSLDEIQDNAIYDY